RNSGLMSVAKETLGIRSLNNLRAGRPAAYSAAIPANRGSGNLVDICASPERRSTERCLRFGQLLDCKRARCYAATGCVAASVLAVMVPLRPLGKKPPCFTPAFPNAR